MVAVFGMPVRPYGRCRRPLRRPIRAALMSLCTSQTALTFGEFPTWDYMRCFSGLRAVRFPVKSLAHQARAACRAGWHARIVPRICSAHSVNRTCGMQHVMPRTRAHVGTRPFQIQSLAAILTVHAAGLWPTWNVSGPDRVDAHVQAMREVRHGPRTCRRANPAR